MTLTKLFLLGEAANYRDLLVSHLDPSVRPGLQIVTLPREAANSPEHDHEIAPNDILVSLRLRRDGKPLPPVRLLHVPGAGLDGIDLDALDRRTAVCNVFEHEGPIAEFVLASILEWEIGIAELRASFAPERWSDIYRSRKPHGEVRGKALGLIGYGRIGRAIAERARAFGMGILAIDAGVAAAEGDRLPPSHLPVMLEQADYVVVACPLTEATRGLIGAGELATMKRRSVLINVSRAEIADEAALFSALSEKRIRGASLDVWYRYPKGADDHTEPAALPFHTLPNAICTPHSSAWTHELMQRRYAVIAENVSALLQERPLRNLVRAAEPARNRKDAS